MRLLLDTHALLWWLADEPMDPLAGQLIADPGNTVFVSAASVWKISVKRALGKLHVDGDLLPVIADSGFAELPITWAHGQLAGQLPRHHRDPFDRMLIAQARIEGVPVVTRAEEFSRYDVQIITA